MSVLMVMEAAGATAEQYERTNEIMGIRGDEDAPEGLIQHVAAIDDGGLVIADLWESEEDLKRFFDERLGAALEQAGLASSAGKPRVMQVHNALEGRPKDAGIAVLIEVAELDSDGYDQMASNMPAHTGDTSQGPWVSHTAALTEGGGIFVLDVWESPEAFGKFAEEQIGPAAGAAGITAPIEPRIVRVHNRIRGKAAV
jgi:heme-degrading monooxygenase HmoA